MKKIRKLASLLLTVVLALCMGSTAWAADIVINNATSGHTYSAYQIFAGDISGNVLIDIQWGTGVSATAQSALGNAQAKAEELEAGDASDARKLAEILVGTTGYLGAPAATTNTLSGSQYKLTGLDAGYYLVTDKSASGAVSAYIVQVVGSDTINIEPKTGDPTFEKKVQDINDSDATPTLSGLQDSADYDIGDEVPFTLTATLPSNTSGNAYGSFEHYYLAFEDTLSEGLTFNPDSIKIYRNTVEEGNRLADKNIIDSDNASDDNYFLSVATDLHGFKMAIVDLTKINSVVEGDKIIVTYTATLNENAEIGAPGNDNTAKLVYSNNPNYTGSIWPGDYGDNDKIDTDGDRIPDDVDDDDDGDTIPDDADDDADGDDIPDTSDKDLDNDGVPNNEEKDSDGDGTPDDVEIDDDNDSVPDVDDDDDDGDGIPDDEDTDDDPSTTTKSAPDTVTVFTFELVIDKIKGADNSELNGAHFALYKYDADGFDAVGAALSGTPADEGITGYANYYLVEEITTGTEFTFTGIDDGKYVLIETETPNPYNSIAPIAFTVTSEHETNAVDPALTSLNATITSGSGSFTAATNNMTVVKLDGTDQSLTSGQIYSEIVNRTGSTLPETGGVGTTIFYIIGAILVVGAGVLLITKKRMDNK